MHKMLPLLMIFLNINPLVERVKEVESGHYDGGTLFFCFLHIMIILYGVDWISGIWKREDEAQEESPKK